MKKESNPSEGFLNESELTFNDISSETQREYTFPNGQRLHIDKPLYLNVSKSGGHRLYSQDKWCYNIQPKEGWWINGRSRKVNPVL